MIAPEVAKMVEEYPNVKFYLYDVEECEDVAHELGVRSMPTFSIFKDGDIQVRCERREKRDGADLRTGRRDWRETKGD